MSGRQDLVFPGKVAADRLEPLAIMTDKPHPFTPYHRQRQECSGEERSGGDVDRA